MPNTNPDVVWRTARDIAESLDVDPETVRRWARENDPRILMRDLPKRGKRYALREVPPAAEHDPAQVADQTTARAS